MYTLAQRTVEYRNGRRMDKVSFNGGICWSTIAPRIVFWEKVVVAIPVPKLIRISELEVCGGSPQRN
jgi:hypothetical protein